MISSSRFQAHHFTEERSHDLYTLVWHSHAIKVKNTLLIRARLFKTNDVVS